MRKACFRTAVCVVALSLSMGALAVPIAVHNTGVDGSDALVAGGAQAAFWTLSAQPVGGTQTIGSNPFRFNCCYFPDTSTAAWVAPQASGSAGANGVYTYDLTFDLAGLDPLTASISGTFGTDNEGSISLNGNAPVATTGAGDFGSPTGFAITSGFLPGSNTLRVTVNNAGDPTAFFVSFTSATASPFAEAVDVPAISWQALVGLALLLAALGSLLARKRPTL